MSDHSSEPGKSVNSASSLLDKLIEFRFFLLIVAAYLILENCLYYFFQKNVLSLQNVEKTPELTLGNAFAFIVFLSFLLSLLFPFLRRLILAGVGSLGARWLHTSNPIDKDPEYKFQSIAERQALVESNEFDFKRIQEYRQADQMADRIANLAFAAGILLATNYWLLGDSTVPTSSQLLINYLSRPTPFGEKTIFTILIASFFVAIAVGFLISLDPRTSDKVYLPKKDDHPNVDTYLSPVSTHHIGEPPQREPSHHQGDEPPQRTSSTIKKMR